MKVSVIIPVYNERSTIDTVLRRVKSAQLGAGIDKEIVVVNDGSSDGTYEIIESYRRDPQVKIIHRDRNCGKSSAIMAGIAVATGDTIIIQDADLEYDPAEYPVLIEPICRGESVVYGSRFKGRITRMPWLNRAANLASNITFNLLFCEKISDIHTCYKVFRKEVLSGLNLGSRHFVFDIKITASLAKRGHRICEVPISYKARTKNEGKKITWRQALELYWCIIKCRFVREKN